MGVVGLVPLLFFVFVPSFVFCCLFVMFVFRVFASSFIVFLFAFGFGTSCVVGLLFSFLSSV